MINRQLSGHVRFDLVCHLFALSLKYLELNSLLTMFNKTCRLSVVSETC